MVAAIFAGCRQKEGCTDPAALNYNENAQIEDSSCVYPDPCLSVACQHGLCEEGICQCDSTHYGTLCQYPFTQLFVGTYSGNETCVSSSGSYTCSVVVTGTDQIQLSGVHNQSFSFVAEVDSVTFSIPVQSFGSDQISGSGSLDSLQNQIFLNYTLVSSGPTEICTAVLSRQ